MVETCIYCKQGVDKQVKSETPTFLVKLACKCGALTKYLKR